MKLKLFLTLLSLTVSAYSQLISIREESVFLRPYPDSILFTPAVDGPVTYNTNDRVQSALSFRDTFSTPAAFTEDSHFASSPRGTGGFVLEPARDTGRTTFTQFTDLVSFDASPAQSDASQTTPDHGLLALITASTNL